MLDIMGMKLKGDGADLDRIAYPDLSHLPPNIAREPRPTKEEVMKRHVSRFAKASRS